MMLNFMRKNTSIKIISFLVALLLWLIALNANNPYKSRELNILLNVINEDTLQNKNIELVNSDYKRSVNITIYGRKEAVDKVGPDDFDATLDFSKINSAADKSLPITGPVSNNKDIEIKLVSPTAIDLDLEAIEKATFPIDITLTGQPKTGYSILTYTEIPETVTLENIKSLIDVADSIKAVIDVTGIDRAMSIKKECKVYNKKDEEIPELSKNLSVEVKIDVARELPVLLDVNGQPADGYVEVSRSLTPSTVLVNGPYETVSKLVTLMTEALDLKNAKASVIQNVNVKLPAGVVLVSSSDILNASVIIDKLVEKTFTIQKTDISLVNMDVLFTYEIDLPEPLAITLKGRQIDLDKIDITHMNPQIDVSGLTEGTHKVLLDLSLPATVTQVKTSEASVKVTGI